MASLPDQDRFETWAEFMAELSASREPVSIDKNDLRAALNAIDAWIDSNAASLNSAIPQPARSGLTASQKARLLVHVVRKRFVRGGA